jgi:hypothetical protein
MAVAGGHMSNVIRMDIFAPAPAQLRSAWRPWAALAVVWLVLVALSCLALWHLRRESLQQHQHELSFLSLALADEIERGARGVEDGLVAIRAELQQGRLRVANGTAVEELRTRVGLMPLVTALWLVDRQGRQAAASAPEAAPSLAIFDDQLLAARQGQMAFSRPVPARDETGALLVLALPFDDAPGLDGGWILAAVPARALLGAFSVAAPAGGLDLAVFRADGTRLLGSGMAGAVPDPSRELAAHQSVDRYRMRLTLTRQLDAMLETWRRIAEATGAAQLEQL